MSIHFRTLSCLYEIKLKRRILQIDVGAETLLLSNSSSVVLALELADQSFRAFLDPACIETGLRILSIGASVL